MIILFEFFERFGFYSMLSLLALFLTADRSTGGFGWEQAPSLRLLGIYTGLMYALPMLGGLIADRVIGHRRAIAVGGAVMLAGYLLFTSPVSVPFLLEALGHEGVASKFAALSVPLGAWQPPAGIDGDVAKAYSLVSLGFWGAIVALVLGNALVKSTLVVVLGDSFAGNDARREAAYAYYYMGINVGALIAGITAGSVAASFGWHAAFATSAIGMGIALLLFLVFRNWLPKRARNTPAEARQSKALTIEDAGESGARTRMALLAIFAALLFLFSAGSFQLWGTMLLFLEHGVDRGIGAFQIPPQWFTSLNSAAVILTSPIFALLWVRLARTNREPDLIGKYVLALLLGAAALLLFAFAAWPRANGTSVGWLIPALAVTVQGAGEVAAWASTYGLVYRLAPRRMVAAVMGAYYAVTLGLGGYVAGWLGQFAESVGQGLYFLAFGLTTVAAAGLAFLLRGQLISMAAASGTSLKG